MKLKIKLSIFILILMTATLNAMKTSNVRITGQAIEYAGDSLHFMVYSDYLTLAEEQLVAVKVDKEGKFDAQFLLQETKQVFIHLGVYKMYLFAQPNGNYDVILPTKRAKTQADLLNPYFEEIELMFGIKNYKESDLNFLIRAFDSSFDPYLSTFALNVYAKQKPEELANALKSLDSSFPNRNDSYFSSYYLYKTGLLRHWAYQFKAKAISIDYFKNMPVLYNNPAYMELFSIVYDKYFSYFGRTAKGKEIYTAVNTEKSLSKLENVLQQDSVFSDNKLKELVIIKCLYDEFYQPNCSRSAILTLLDSVAISSVHAENKAIAQRMKQKITQLMVGYEPPAFSLTDTSGRMYTLQSWKGKLVYLNFCTSFSYSSLKDFALLQNLKERLGDKIEIVTILADNVESIRSFSRQNNYSWKFLSFSNQSEVLKKYDIRAFPTYFLISPEGKLLRSPAKGPSEGVEEDLLIIERNRIREAGQ